MRIVKLEPSKRKRGRWLVWLEDGTLLRVGEGDVAARGLYSGRDLDGEELEALEDSAQCAKLKERALSLLSARPMSKKELLDKLTAPPRYRPGQKPDGDGPEDPDALEARREALARAAARVADRLEELGLLDDRAYASTVVRHYAAKGFGERRIKSELYRRGVPREYWEDALDEAGGREDGGEALDALLERRLRGAEPTRENLKKASGYLARRGFGWSEISDAIERYKDKYEDEGGTY